MVLGVEWLSQGAFAKIQVLQDAHWEAAHPLATIDSHEKESAKRNYENLRELISKFLGTTLTRSVNGDAELFGRPLGKASLSDGQTVLLQFCVLIYSQAEKLSELIVLMDEPENHLHAPEFAFQRTEGKLVDNIWQ